MVKIRLARIGRTHSPKYRIVVSDSRRIPNSRALAQLGSFDPINDTLSLNEEEALEWLRKGAIPSDTVRSILSKKGIIKKYNDEKIALRKANKKEGK